MFETRQPTVRLNVATAICLRRAVPILFLALIALAVGLVVGFVIASGKLDEVRKRGTNIGNVLLLAECKAGQVLRFNTTTARFSCAGDVWNLGDIEDVNVRDPKPKDEECLCFNLTDALWEPQGPFLKEEDKPPFENGTLPCENLPDDLCDAIRWGTPVGTWNADANVPLLSSGGCPFGDFYVVNVTGNTDLDGNVNWDVGDALVCSSTGWNRIGKDIPVLSVNGMTGNVMLGLDALTDVDLTGQINEDFLGSVGGVWIPQPIGIFLDNLTDVNAAGAAAGDVILFDTSAWELNSTCCGGEGDTAQRQGMRAQRTTPQSIISTPLGLQKAQFNAELDDPGGNYDPVVNFEYTAPITGFYGAWASFAWFEPILGGAITNWGVRGQILLNALPVTFSLKFIGNTNNVPAVPSVSGNDVHALGYFRMNAGDKLSVQVGQTNDQGSSVSISGGSGSTFTVVFYGPI